MATSVTSQSDPYVDKLVVDTQANATPENHVLGSAAANYIFDVDNSNNSAAVYAKFFDIGVAGVTVGTTEPSILMLVPANTRQVLTVSSGVAFATGLSFACVAGKATSNAVNPVNNVTIRVMAE